MTRTSFALSLLCLLGLVVWAPLACSPDAVNGNAEVCGDGVDNDNDGIIDEGEDKDGDTYRDCDIGDLLDCDDDNADVHPGASEACDEIDNDCNGAVDDLDVDQDGHISDECNGPDCDDSDPDVFPGNPESCDGDDNNCDGAIDDGFDADDDGWTSCNGDCKDSDPLINPDAEELCDGIDNNCNCSLDTNDDNVRCGPGDVNVDEAFDGDEDGFVDSSNPFCSDIYGEGGIGEEWGDCDDSEGEILPGAHELVGDAIDNDCDGCTDECQDADNDGFDTCSPGDPGDSSCSISAESLNDNDGELADCDDSPNSLYAPYVYPGFTTEVQTQDGPVTVDEICDRVDNDCDGEIDEGYDPDTCDLLD